MDAGDTRGWGRGPASHIPVDHILHGVCAYFAQTFMSGAYLNCGGIACRQERRAKNFIEAKVMRHMNVRPVSGRANWTPNG